MRPERIALHVHFEAHARQAKCFKPNGLPARISQRRDNGIAMRTIRLSATVAMLALGLGSALPAGQARAADSPPASLAARMALIVPDVATSVCVA